ncbi:hypothetical protein G6F61_014001 [Rhizopus arrhizus]|nr:hypothetical protein G6F61_014001 [Rhizopus arrhizus]
MGAGHPGGDATALGLVLSPSRRSSSADDARWLAAHSGHARESHRTEATIDGNGQIVAAGGAGTECGPVLAGISKPGKQPPRGGATDRPMRMARPGRSVIEDRGPERGHQTGVWPCWW